MKILLAGVCLLATLSLPALAQVGPSYGAQGGQGFTGGPSGLPSRHKDDDSGSAKDKDETPVPPPAAIPGAQPDPDAAVIPAEKVAAELSPNDALFDAINRGDLGAAKDAVNRGAQLDAHNVLGQTPTEAAIDLSRNDITFLLLSLRGAVASSRPVHAAEAHPPAKPGHGRPVKVAAGRHVATVAANDRGTPNPAAGFTGF